MKNVLVVGQGGGYYGEWLMSNIEGVSVKYIEDREAFYIYADNHDKPDLLFFIGGADVNPNYYNEEIGKYTNINRKHDALDFTVVNYYGTKVPKLGVCRGSQFLTIHSGGKLIQNVTNHTQEHQITTVEGLTYKITSTHHQMCIPNDVKDFKLLAWSKHFRSTTYTNGDNEEIDLPKGFLEPEIFYYPNTTSLGIQGHPEFHNCPEDTQKYCLKLIKKLIKKEL